MFTDYINRFLDLLERFVVAAERRNELLENTENRMADRIVSAAASAKTTVAQDVVTAEKQIAAAEPAKESASKGSASDAAATPRGRGRNRAAVAGTDTAEPEAAADAPAPTGGRRQRVRAADAANEPETTEQEAAGTESTAAPAGGRRQRVRAGAATEKKQPEAASDTPEQADMRGEIESLCALAGDVDDAAADVKEYLDEKGWGVAANIPSADLEEALDALNEIADKYFE